MTMAVQQNHGADHGASISFALAGSVFLKDFVVELKGVEPSTSRVRF